MAITSPWQASWPWRALMLAQRRQDTPIPVPKAGAYETFEDLIAGREPDVFGYLWRLTGDEQTAYDLCQETFLRAWQQFSKIRHYEQPGAWLFRVATNLALNAIERRSRASRHVAPLDENDLPTVEDHSGHLARLDMIHQTLLQLPARERAALVLREVEGFSNDEIGHLLDISANSVRMLLSRARAHFRQHYQRYDSEEAHA